MTGASEANRNRTAHICATCREPLTWMAAVNAVTDTTEDAQWVHLYPADHTPDPVPFIETIEKNPRCDFCSTSTIGDGYVYPADRVVIYPAGTTKGSMEYDNRGWYACLRCAPLVEKGDPDILAARIATLLEQRPGRTVPYPIMKAQLTELYRTFMESRTGPRLRYVDYRPPE